MMRNGVFAALILVLFTVVQTPALAATGTAWDWRVNVISGQSFDSQQQAEAALRALGGQYALASVVESQNVGQYWTSYTYGARPRAPDIGPWYDYSIQRALINPHPTEESAIASVVAWGDENRKSCTGPTVVTPSGDWRPWKNWYSGDSYEETRFYNVTYDVYPACDRVTASSQAWRKRVVECPAFMAWSSTSKACELHSIATISAPARVCTNDNVGNPCSASTGNKTLQETDLSLPWITFTRTYQSQISVPYGGFGNHWTHSLNVRGVFASTTYYGVVTGSGHPIPLQSTGGEALDGSGEAITGASGSNKQWLRRDGTTRLFQAQGRLLRDDLPNGQWYTYAYDSFGRLTTATHSSGRALSFVYESGPASAESRITEIKVGTTVLVSYEYDTQGNLVLVHRADGTTRQYHYEDAAFPWHLTGVTDENGTRFATYAYDAIGRAISSEHAGGAERVELAYQTDGSTIVTDALGKESTYRFTSDSYYRKPLSIEFDGATESWTFPTPASDFRRRPTQSVDRNGVITAYQYSQLTDSLGTILRTRRIEAFGTPRQRTIDTDRRYGSGQIVKEVAGGKTTSYTYNTRRQTVTRTEKENATTLQRVTTYGYCESVDVVAGCPSIGLLKSVDGPRTDVADVTSFEYDAQGNLYRAINPLGHVTTYDTYNVHGQPLTITDPNGVVTSLTYDLRQRLTSRTVGSETTTFAYWPTGLLKKSTLPDGSYIEYTYDAAHRLTDINDAEGNRIHYSLDAMGNRIGEQAYDPSNSLTRTRTRVFDTLSRLQEEIGAAGTANVTTTFGYDNNGNQTSVTAPLGRDTTQGYDELNRLTSVSDPLSGVTQYGYNALDQLISVTDSRGLATSYSYNALGDLAQQTSPDTGATVNTYDSAGNLATSTDARNAVASYTYDALNRVATASFSDGSTTDQTLAYTYDAGTNGKGRLTGVSDASHSLSWTYDDQGRVLTATQVVGSISKTTTYTYANGLRQSMTTPSGQVISYGYTDGKVTSISANGNVVVSGILYDPFGPIRQWTWADNSLAVRTFDQDGNIALIDSAGLKTYSYDDAFRITGITDTTNSALSWTYGYDDLDRLTSASKTGTTLGYTYDANGNRLTETGSTPSTFTVAANSNRLSSTSGSLSRTYGYDNAGNTTSFTGISFTYSNRGRMSSSTKSGVTTNYVYNALGQLVKKASNTLYYYDDAGHILGIYDGSGALMEETVWLGDTPIATLRPQSGGGVRVYNIHTDHLNTPRIVTDSISGAVRWRWDGEPFGGGAVNENPSGAGAFEFGLRFPGQIAMVETGLHYNYFRDYDPATGRYAQSDPIGLRGGLNTYAYVRGNPVHWTDPLGLDARAPGIPLVWPPAFTPGTREYDDLVDAGQRAWNDFSDWMSDFFDAGMRSSLTDEAERAGDAAAGELDGEGVCPPGDGGGSDNCKQIARKCNARCRERWLSSRFAGNEGAFWIGVCEAKCAQRFGCGTYYK